MLDNILEVSVCEKVGVSDILGKNLYIFISSMKKCIDLGIRHINAYSESNSVFVGLSTLARGPTNENQLSLFSKPLLL